MVRNANMSLVMYLREEIANILVSIALSVVSKDLENRTWWLERSEKWKIAALLVVESSKKKSDIGVDWRLGVDVIKSYG